jgi:lipopolysaccharide export LptBFGC system permease protein LptF
MKKLVTIFRAISLSLLVLYLVCVAGALITGTNIISTVFMIIPLGLLAGIFWLGASVIRHKIELKKVNPRQGML